MSPVRGENVNGPPLGLQAVTRGGYITIASPYDGLFVTLLLDEQSPTPSGDFGGWETVTIPRKRPIRFWSTNPEAKLELQVLVEKQPELTVAQQIRRLRSMGTADDDRRPRQVELSGHLPPLPVDRWVIDDVTWGAGAIYNDAGLLIRQPLTITFGEPPTLDAVDVKRGGRSRYRTGTGARKATRYARIKAGETLQEFAARTLGAPSRWEEIAKLQKPPIRDPRSVKDGRKLRLP